MSYKTKMALPILGMAFLFGFAAISVVTSDVEEIKQPLPASVGHLSEVKLIEVRDAGEQVVLSGSFSGPVSDGKEIERTAELTSSGVDPDAKGRAEIEIETANNSTEQEQELELDVSNLAPGATFRLFLDGREAASFTTNHKGQAELEVGNSATNK